MPGLVIEDGPRRRRARATAPSACSRLGSAFPSAWLVRSICRRSAASPRSSVAAMVERDRGDRRDVAADARRAERHARLAVLEQADRQERRLGVEPGPVRGEQDLQRRRLAERPAGGERPGVDAVQRRGPHRDGPSGGSRAIGSVPTRVSSTSVSGRKSRCWRGVLDGAELALSAASRARGRGASSPQATGRSTRSTGIGPSQSSPPVSSKVDEPDDGGSS